MNHEHLKALALDAKEHGVYSIQAIYDFRAAASHDAVLALIAENEKLRGALLSVQRTLLLANEELDGPIRDTIWYSDHETLFDFIDATLAASPAAKEQCMQMPTGEAPCARVCESKAYEITIAQMRQRIAELEKEVAQYQWMTRLRHGRIISEGWL